MFITGTVDFAKRISLWAIVVFAIINICSCRSFSTRQQVNHSKTPVGKMIAFIGISGSGKSTLSRELGKLINAKTFLEPEEKDWPNEVRKSYLYGEFSALSSLRNLRIQNLYDADNYRKQGLVTIVDSYYDKITHYYLEKPGMEWLISPKDPYFPVAQMLMKIDEETLPNADCIVFLDIDLEIWKKFITRRNRDRDSIDGFQESVFAYRRYVEDATHILSKKHGIKVIRFRPSMDEISVQALRLKQILIDENIL